MPKPTLTYLFEAEYKDGHIYSQHPDDFSLKFPPTIDEAGEMQGRSAGADIQEDLDNDLISRVSLVGRGNKITVDLTTGLFEINGLQVILESNKLPILPDRFVLVRYYQVTQVQHVTYKNSDGTKVSESYEPEFREYFLGWKCTINGRVYEEKIAVS